MTGRERGHIDAIAAMYVDNGKVDHRTRVQNYLKAMEQVAQRCSSRSSDGRSVTVLTGLASICGCGSRKPVRDCTEHRAQSTEHRAQSTEHRAQSGAAPASRFCVARDDDRLRS
jgi:hypothetical protein